jgi:hypothetical protein
MSFRKAIMKKLVFLLLLSSCLVFTFTVSEGNFFKNIDMMVENMHPIRNPEIWINGDDSLYYSASTIDLQSIASGIPIVIDIQETKVDVDFPSDILYYAVFFGHPSADSFTIVDLDSSTHVAYLDPGDAPSEKKFRKTGKIDNIPILQITNNSGSNSSMWMSFLWIVRIPDSQQAVKAKKANVKVNIN